MPCLGPTGRTESPSLRRVLQVLELSPLAAPRQLYDTRPVRFYREVVYALSFFPLYVFLSLPTSGQATSFSVFC